MPAADLAGRGLRDVRRRSRAASTREVAGSDERVPGVGRRVRQARRRRLGRGRSHRAGRSRASAAAIADGPDAFYTGWIADRIAEDMAANGGLITQGGSGGVPGGGARAGARHVPRSRNHLDAAAELRRRRADRDAEHARGAGHSENEARTPPRRCTSSTEAMRRAFLDRARFLGDPDFVAGARRQAHAEAARTRSGRRPISLTEGVEQRRARQGHRHRAAPARSPKRRRTSR